MSRNTPKYKIIFQTKSNVWGKYNNENKFNKKKWGKFLKYLDFKKTNFFLRKPKSLKVLYKQRLLNKQKFKSFYGNITYNKLKTIYNEIKTKNSFNIVENLIIRLESRLDVFLYRSGLFPSIFEAKQWVNHKKIKVNKTIVNNNNYVLKSGDFIEIPTNLKYKKIMLLPYSHIDNNLPILVFLRKPRINEIKYPFKFNSNFLFEYLNKN